MLKDPINLEKYKIINNRINEETKEIYLVNSLFLVINSGLSVANIFSNTNTLKYIGLIMSFFWFISLIVAYNYKSQWIKMAKELEDEDGIWRSSPEMFPKLIYIFTILPILFSLTWFLNLK